MEICNFRWKIAIFVVKKEKRIIFGSFSDQNVQSFDDFEVFSLNMAISRSKLCVFSDQFFWPILSAHNRPKQILFIFLVHSAHPLNNYLFLCARNFFLQ